MYLSPRKIHFTKCLGEETATKLAEGNDIDKLTRHYSAKGKFPKLQVVEKDGNFFTLDNTQLQVFRKLHEQGKCKTIKVEKVSVRRIPEGILKLMTIEKRTAKSGGSDGSSGSAENLSRGTDLADDRQNSTDSKVSRDKDEADSLSTYSLESDVESVDSVPCFDYEYYSYESSTDASTESEVEEEEESLI